ncbi:hypothetical protein D9M73_203970 [compost metagenome]
MQCPGGLRRAQHRAAELQDIRLEPVGQRRLRQYLGAGETQVVARFASHIETEREFVGSATRQQHHMRNTG